MENVILFFTRKLVLYIYKFIMLSILMHIVIFENSKSIGNFKSQNGVYREFKEV